MQASHRYDLYPPIEPYRTGRISAGGGHEIYFEECGNPAGTPALIVHGGPGGGSNPTMRRFHDPGRYRMILFDQRGCGRSTPNASLEENTTWHLIEDMEALRRKLSVNRWQLFGGSWGSTLSLAYAQKHPDVVSNLILRGIFLLRRKELHWFYQEGCSWIFPDAFEKYQAVIAASERADMISAYYRLLTHSDHDVSMAAARAWSAWEGSTLALLQDSERIKLFASPAYAYAFARIECHYFINQGFLKHDNQLLEDAFRLNKIPGKIVHGRYDVVTPVQNAWDLKKAWPSADLVIVPDAGHAMTESGIIHELVKATREYALLAADV